MVLERAEFLAKPDKVDELIEVLKTRALPLTAAYTGCLSFKAMRCVEEPDTIMFLAEWESLEAHLASRHEAAHVAFRDMLLPYAAAGKGTFHFTEI
jgi:quinol monooxygenase YgiN